MRTELEDLALGTAVIVVLACIMAVLVVWGCR